MKTICLSILFVLTTSLVSGQTNKKNNDESVPTQCVMHYSDDKWTTLHCGDTTDHQCEDLVIRNLPPMSQKTTPVLLDIDYKGDYGILKDQSLQIPGEYVVMIKDVLNGESYNLDSSEPHFFSIKKPSQLSRFVLEIKYNKDNMLVNYLRKEVNRHLF
jgi:hypothetical protein